MTGRLLVALQFVCLALLVWPWSAASFSALGSILFVSGAVLGLWTLAFNRIGNFNIHPAPKAGAVFITGGPYRYVRQPMYTALMIVCAGIVCWYGSWQKAACWLCLGAVLYAKSRVEEVALKQAFPDYEAYLQRTQRFIPFIF